MKNCFCEGGDLLFTAKLITPTIEQDNYGYYIRVSVPKSYVLPLMDLKIPPVKNQDSNWELKVRVSSTTKIRINDIRVSSLEHDIFKKVKPGQFTIKYLIIKNYARHTRHDCACYATILSLRINTKWR